MNTQRLVKRFREFTLEMHGRPSAPLELKTRAVRLRQVESARVPLRRAASDGESIVVLTAPHVTGSKGIEATLHKRRILFAGFAGCTEDTRLPKYVIERLVGNGGGHHR